MQNIPVFATEYGVGSLTLKDIPYRKTAYIKIQSSLTPAEFLCECVSFCRAAGAEKIYASGHDMLTAYPFHTAVWCMARERAGLADTEACLFPVTDRTLNRWLELYNQKMQGIANAAYMTFIDGKMMLSRGDGYFIHKEGKLLGIGIASGERIDLIASLQPGAGQEIILALNHALSGDRVTLEVASINEKAIRLYERMGFIKTAEISRWYKIF